MFFSFDGIDGVGKSTQMELFCQWLHEQGRDVVTCRDPGSTPLGEHIRAIVLNSGEDVAIGPRAEMLLYMAARAQLVDEVIRPALAQEKTVVSDRFLLANVVYQGHAGGLDLESVRQVGRVAVDGLEPDCTYLLDMSPEAAKKRMGEQLDRMEKRGDDFRQRLRKGYLKEAEQNSSMIHTIDADRPLELIQEEIRELASQVISG